MSRRPDRKSRLVLEKYTELSESNFRALKGESVQTIEFVLGAHKKQGTLPEWLRGEFPALGKREWFWPWLKKIDFTQELKFAIARLHGNNKRLQLLLDLRSQFSREIVLGRLANAKVTLDAIMRDLGESTWSIEAQALLASVESGFEGVRTYLLKFAENNPGKFVLGLAEFACRRVDSTVSVLDYREHVSRIIQAIPTQQDRLFPSYLYFLLGDMIAPLPDNEHAAYFLVMAESQPVIDHYLILEKILQSLAIQGSWPTELDPRTVHKVLSPGLELDGFRIFTNGRATWPLADEYRKAEHAFVKGKFKHSMSVCRQAIAYDPLSIPWYDLYCKACIAANEEVSLPDYQDTLAEHILWLLYSFQCQTEDSVFHALDLLKIGIQLSCTPMGRQLGAIANRFALNTCDQYLELQYMYGGCHTLPIAQLRDVLPKRHKLKWNIEPDRCYANEQPINVYIDSVRAFANGNLNDAIEGLESFLSGKTRESPSYHEALRMLCACLIEVGEYNRCVELLATSELFGYAICNYLDVDRVVLHYNRRSKVINQACIMWPILHAIDYYFVQKSNREATYDAFANYLAKSGIQRPSELLTADTRSRVGVSESQAANFLWLVCRPEIIDSWYVFESTDSVESERVTILQGLQLLAPEFAKSFTEEISALQKQIAIRSVLSHVVGGKIYYNIEGIGKSLDKSLIQKLTRYFSMNRVSEKMRQTPTIKWTQNDETAYITFDESLSIFMDLFDQIWRAALFSNHYGLNSCLSVRIRHQTIKGAIRSVFDREHLISEKKGGAYLPIQRWRQIISGVDPDKSGALDQSFAEFSAGVDQLIEQLSSRWLRIRGSDGGDEGWFELSFALDELLNFHLEARTLTNIDSFFHYVAEKIKIKLSANLTLIRERITGELRESLNQMLDELSRTVQAQNLGTLGRELYSSITRCRTFLQNRLEEVANWFRIQEDIDLEDFSLETLISASVENVSKCFPLSGFKCDVEIDCHGSWKGRFFTPLWYGLFTVFENVVSHGLCGSEHPVILTVRECDGRVFFRIENETSPEKAADQKDKVANWNTFRPELIGEEGGSGLSKLRNIIHSDLGDRDGDVEFEIVDGRFVTCIRLTSELMKAHE